VRPAPLQGTAFQNAWLNDVVWNAMVGWTGIDQYDAENQVGQEFLGSGRRVGHDGDRRAPGDRRIDVLGERGRAEPALGGPGGRRRDRGAAVAPMLS
jgi:hypothetical protein